MTGHCGVCPRPALVHESRSGIVMGWCLTHAPERYDMDVARIHAINDLIGRWEVGEDVLSWRAAASMAFTAGIEFAREQWVELRPTSP